MAILGTLAGYCDIGVLGVKGLNTGLKIIQFIVALTSCGREVRFHLYTAVVRPENLQSVSLVIECGFHGCNKNKMQRCHARY